MTPRSKIFLSYSHQDGQEACDHFDQSFPAALAHWRDRTKLSAGDDWKQKAGDTIRKCDAVIAFITPSAVTSAAVKWEWETALSLGKRLIPLVIKPCPIPEFLPSSIIRLDLTGSEYTYAPTRIADELQQRWNDVQSQLTDLEEELQQNPDSAAVNFFSNALNDLRRKLDTQPSPAMPPEIFELAIGIVRRLVNSYPQIDEPLDRLIEGTYCEPPEWASSKVFQSQHGLYFKPIFNRLRSALSGRRLRVVVVAMICAEAAELGKETIFAGIEPVIK